jgi:hypothetical protein
MVRSRPTGHCGGMRRVIKKRIRHQDRGLNVAADVNAVISVDEGSGETQKTVSKSHSRIVQADPDEKEKEDR